MNKKQLAAANLDFDVSSIKGTDGKLIPNLGCAIEIEQWLKKLSLACGRRHSNRALPYLEKAIDVIYSEVEAELYRQSGNNTSAYEASAVTKHPVWQFFVERVTKKFGSVVKVIQPHRSPTESVRSKLINRTFFQMLHNKHEVLKRSHSSILASGELGQAKVEILDAQVNALRDAYFNHAKCNAELWPAINALFQKGNTRSVEGKVNLEDGSVTFEASQALFAEAKVEFEKTWDFGKMKNQIKASAEIGARESSKFSASAKINKGALDGIGHSRELFSGNKEKSVKSEFEVNKVTGNATYSIDDSVVTTQIIPGIDLEIDAMLAAEMGMKLTVSHELSVADFMALKSEGELFVGATAKVQFTGAINSASMFSENEVIKTKIGASAFVGAKASGTSTFTLKARGMSMLSGCVTGSASVGLGASAALEAIVKGSGDFTFKAGAGATMGVGTGVEFGTMVNPMLLKVLLWDSFGKHLRSKQTKRKTGIKYNRNVNQVAVSRCEESIMSSLNMIEADYRVLAEELWRIPTFTNMSTKDEVTTMHDRIASPDRNVMDKYLETLGVTDAINMSPEDITQAAVDMDNQARFNQSQNMLMKQAKKAASKRGAKSLSGGLALAGMNVMNPAMGLLAVKP
ncbi:hypothetical protein DEB41_06970 [Vibrio anguillarum]|uniref:Uncharacterized protein n=4 Tax=Vibrio anguillarum TaxID=55601 RepID=A0A1Y0NXI5_VIBAN|nr:MULTISPECIES: hypothetical protein [Vibrio]AEH33035.1 hypothetical protein VAA_03020 [Vibrio anguillarum 775]AGU57558.1 hypothetical protein N175_07430 [Vibrio anguillarum M3]ARV27018.1 hypothetical protein A6A12_1371 [Vibrio anguillarum]ASF92003.1 hypothetical protein CEA93_08105 [Vibrio anguillarum]ASG07527.1 hypothetical protein CEQ50_08095 [Vibrio anguillarum]